MQNKNNLLRILVNLILSIILCAPITCAKRHQKKDKPYTTNNSPIIVTSNKKFLKKIVSKIDKPFVKKDNIEIQKILSNARQCENNGDIAEREVNIDINQIDNINQARTYVTNIKFALDHYEDAFNKYKRAFDVLEIQSQLNTNLSLLYRQFFNQIGSKLANTTRKYYALLKKLSTFNNNLIGEINKKYVDEVKKKYESAIDALTYCSIAQQKIRKFYCNQLGFNHFKLSISESLTVDEKRQLEKLCNVKKRRLLNILHECSNTVMNIGYTHEMFNEIGKAITQYHKACTYRKKAYFILKYEMLGDQNHQEYIQLSGIYTHIMRIYLSMENNEKMANEKMANEKMALEAYREWFALETPGAMNSYGEAKRLKGCGKYQQAIDKFRAADRFYRVGIGNIYDRWYQLLSKDITNEIDQCNKEVYFKYHKEATTLIEKAQKQSSSNSQSSIVPDTDLLIGFYNKAIQKYKKVQNIIPNEENQYRIKAENAIQELSDEITRIGGAQFYSIN